MPCPPASFSNRIATMTITGKKYVECTLLGSSGGAEAEDSSYDSDYETEDKPESSVNGNTPATSKLHPDVSRTTSDTLAAEFAEYVTVQNGAPAPAQTPGYTARVEFALKLGYTERLVQAALQKLGPEPGQNELLAELIKLGASSAPRLADTPDDKEALLPESADDGLASAASGIVAQESVQLRPVVIDGSNVAMSHGNKEVFSCKGIKICVEWFRARGHKEITVFVPKWRKESSRPDNPVVDQDILGELERERLLVFTPSRLVGGKRMVCYDDRYILRLAAEVDGVVVSNDNYRDLAQENPEFRKVVEERILMYSFVNDRFMPPDDPLGRSGPTLENFLKAGPQRTEPAPPCPYAKKCTYGNKCKFRHPERGPHPHKSVTERLVEHAQRHLQARAPSLSFPLSPASGQTSKSSAHSSLGKTQSWAPGHTFHTGPGHAPEVSDFSKSRSVENVYVEYPQRTVYPSTNQQCSQASLLGWVAPGVSNSEPEPANMHRKLQRQLSLNPNCDTRLNQLRRYNQQPSPSPQYPINSLQSQPRTVSQHTQLSRQSNNGDSYSSSASWEQQQRNCQHRHQHVTRISSAPDSFRACSRSRMSGITNVKSLTQATVQRHGASDTQLNLLVSQPPGWGSYQHQDARRHLHYHLANIFPEEQVQAAMALNPQETDPQQICAAILSMFPKL